VARRRAIDRYRDAASGEDRALARGLVDAKESRLPRTRAEAKALMRDPFATYDVAHGELNRALKAVGDGASRSKARPLVPANTNNPLLRALEAHDPRLYQGALTQRRLRLYQDMLRKHHAKLRRRSDEALAKAIQRERNRRAAPK
jgi:hypothetical protein